MHEPKNRETTPQKKSQCLKLKKFSSLKDYYMIPTFWNHFSVKSKYKSHKSLHIEAILAVMDTTQLVVKIRPKNKFRPQWDLNP